MMTSASTEPTVLNHENIELSPAHIWRLSNSATTEMWEHYSRMPYGGAQKVGLVFTLQSDTVDHEVKFLRYGEGWDTWVVVDFGEPVSEFPKEQQEVINLLRSNGRPVLSEKLVTMLRDVQEDPDGPKINIVSLRQMTQLFIEHQDFADPFIGPDSRGIVYAQWRIVGDGVLIIRFPDDERILLVAQADKTSDSKELDISIRRPKSEVLEEYGHLVPLRH